MIAFWVTGLPLCFVIVLDYRLEYQVLLYQYRKSSNLMYFMKVVDRKDNT